MSGMDAIALLENLGLNVRFQGVGRVASQSLAKGRKINKGMTIVLKLS
jgi:cell division protein FtsI (penicillin-binding protein 3)